jgi:hypothetical protein
VRPQEVYAERVRHAEELAAFGDLDGALRLIDHEDAARIAKLAEIAAKAQYDKTVLDFWPMTYGPLTNNECHGPGTSSVYVTEKCTHYPSERISAAKTLHENRPPPTGMTWFTPDGSNFSLPQEAGK